MPHNTNVNQDLQNERNKCDFNIEELVNFLDGGIERTKHRRDIENKVLSVEGLLDQVPEDYLSHKERYENGIRKAVLLYRTLQNLDGPVNTEEDRLRFQYRNKVVSAVFKDTTPMITNLTMFIPCIAGQGDDKQKEYWLKKAENMEIIGTYVLTELGHGTFIRGLETTATYDPTTEEFVLHSPTLSSYKWWPGGLGHTVNHCIVVAQMYSKEKYCGIQSFIVQIRDTDTHMPLPGIKVGEIGPKLGFNTVNNGFLAFDNHRIPRDRMLMRNAQILKDGTFIAASNSKLAYGTMVFVRVIILEDMSAYLAKAATIAVRYSAVRRQSQPKPNEPEPQVLDYVTQQHKLFIAISSSHAFSNSARWIKDFYSNITKELSAGKMDRLPELHALTCCLKAVVTSDAATLVEQCRLACGGHGFMRSSNLPNTYTNVTAACTYEGDHTVLMLQTARFLVKAWKDATKGGNLSPTVSYLTDKNSQLQFDGSVDGIVKAFQKVAIGKIKLCVTDIESLTRKGVSPEDAWNKTSVQLVAASEAHCRAVLIAIYKSEVDRRTPLLSLPVKRVLQQLVQLYAIYWTLERLGDFLLYTSISENDVRVLRRGYEDLLEKIRPNAVGLVDAFDFRDEILNSTLGAYDGRVYERLMEEAMKSQLNAEPVNQTFHKYLKPLMQGKL